MKFSTNSLVIFAILFLGFIQVYAQPVNNEIKSSINARQFISATSGYNSLQTGQLSTNLPLFNLQAKGINIPISLYFNAGDIDHESEASSVGLGWSLLAGGVISKTTRDAPDQSTASPTSVPWQYQEEYIQIKLSQSNPYPGMFVSELDYLTGSDKEPDVFNYSFLDFSGEIYLKHNQDGSVIRKLAPHVSFKIDNTALGYKIIDDKGIVYFFESREARALSATSWFLTRIVTPEGGEVLFQYADDRTWDLSNIAGSNTSAYESKRLTRIDYDNGWVTFGSAPREDMYYNGGNSDGRRTTSIEHYNKAGSLIKGYELGNNGYIIDTDPYYNGPPTYQEKRMKLSSLREYGGSGENKAPYIFEYEHDFQLNKASSQSMFFPIAENTWAYNPLLLISADRNRSGQLVPWLEWVFVQGPGHIYYVRGYNTTPDELSGRSINDYFCMSKMKFPSGGEESYSYEKHDYSYLGTYSNPITEHLYGRPHFIKGKRLRKKEIKDNNGNTEIIEYKYFDGILINPSIHYSTIYKSSSNNLNPPLEASPYYTQKPQNTLQGSPIYYAKIEENFISTTGVPNGKKVYYFDKMFSQLPLNYFITTYGNDVTAFVNLPNVLGGKQQFHSNDNQITNLSNIYGNFLAYPLGRFYESTPSKGKLLKEIILDATGKIIRKIENEYTPGYAADQTTFGYMVKKFDDTDYSVGSPYNYTYKYRYLISQMVNRHGFKQLLKTSTTNYYQTDSTTEEQVYNYTSKNLLRSNTVTQSNGETITQANVYPDDIEFQTLSGLSAHAASIKRMKEINMTNVPIQTAVKKGTQYISGNYITYKQLPNGAIVTDTVFNLEGQSGSLLNQPLVNLNGKVERNGNFAPKFSTMSYDVHANPVTKVHRGGVVETVIWGYGGKYPIAKIENYTYNQVQNNTALVNQLALLDDYTNVTTDLVRTNLSSCNQAIRNSLPGTVLITTYTYDPLIGVTSETDAKGNTIYYEYDGLQRLKITRDKDGRIIKNINYHHQNQ